ncbi:visual pigment-like receptor peropsin [Patella vulgata]|uniref:visual pigment-like receptor peropsin n=1 Tax=Patella vulgata TaxID=6465 RepID=UPI00218037D3|nr:visual pigment-like receptor peropsin [Patella vulgata]
MTVGEFTRFEHSVVGMLYMIFGIFGSLLSFFSVMTFIREKALFKSGRAWLHISLALANLGVVGAFPFSGSSSFSGRWLYGSNMCQFYGFVGMFSGIAAIGNIFALCIERYMVCRQKEEVDKASNSFYWMATGLVWVNAFFWAIMPVLGWGSYDIEPSGTSCTIKWQNYDGSYPSYIFMLTFVCFILPLPIALISLLMSPTTDTERGEVPKPQTFFTQNELRMICCYFLGLTAVGWGSYCFICMWALFADTENVSMLASVIPPLSAKSMVLLYPLGYCMANNRFKEAFLSVLSFTDKPKTT